MTTKFSEYAERYSTIRMQREAGVLELTFHTDGGPLRWGALPHAEFAQAFSEIGRDPENRVIIMIGTGDEFSGPVASTASYPRLPASEWDDTYREGVLLTTALLNLDAILISCINGPAVRHPEIPLLADIVLASPDAYIQDSAHFVNNMLPGDGVHFVFPLLMGLNRARYFLITGQQVSAQTALDWGLVNEIVPRADLLARARELAGDLASRNPMLLRYTRQLFMQDLKRRAVDQLGFGLALEGLDVMSQGERDNPGPA